MFNSDTIYVLSTAAGRAAIAVIRLSGKEAHNIATSLCAGKPLPSERMLAVRNLFYKSNGAPIDEAMVARFNKPNSYTGEDMVEIHLHGGSAIVNGLMNELSSEYSLRLADPGEFTKRAFLSGKMSLISAEAVADIIDAQTMIQARFALNQNKGRLSVKSLQWKEKLLYLLAMVEANIDFSDEGDVNTHESPDIRADLSEILDEIISSLESENIGERIRNGINVALIGPPNAGKSTLLNRLAQREAAIVSPISGTTRDVISVSLDIDGYPINLYDTAGLRDEKSDTLDVIEAEGIRRSLQKAAEADVVLLLSAYDNQSVEFEIPNIDFADDCKIIEVINKVDLKSHSDLAPSRKILNASPKMQQKLNNIKTIEISAEYGDGVECLKDAIVECAKLLTNHSDEVAIITRQRHKDELINVCNYLQEVISFDQIDLQAEGIRLGLRHLGKLHGETNAEDVLDLIFANFCIGK